MTNTKQNDKGYIALWDSENQEQYLKTLSKIDAENRINFYKNPKDFEEEE